MSLSLPKGRQLLVRNVNYLLRLCSASRSIWQVELVGCQLNSDESHSTLVLEFNRGSDLSWDQENFLPESVTVHYEDGIPELVLLSQDGSVTLIAEASHETPITQLGAHSFTRYDSPECIPVSFFHSIYD